jgi:hypothetical protein
MSTLGPLSLEKKLDLAHTISDFFSFFVLSYNKQKGNSGVSLPKKDYPTGKLFSILQDAMYTGRVITIFIIMYSARRT